MSPRRKTNSSGARYAEHIEARVEIRCAVERAIDELTDPFRVAFMLRFVEHMSIEQRRACFGIPEGAVKTRVHRAERRLHQVPGE